VIPQGLAGVETQLWLWMIAMIRPGAAFIAAPVFGAPQVPVQLRAVVALALGIPAFANTPFVMPVGGIVSIDGVFLIAGEALIGLALGFAVQIGFSTALLAGEVVSNAMGLGFAAMMDPATGATSPAVSQYLSLLAMFLFLATGGHLQLAAIIVESYQALPPGQGGLGGSSIQGLVLFGGELFSAGLAIALPVGFAIILVQLVMAMLARSAPQMNIFAVGLPATLMGGIILIAIASPVMADGITSSLQRGLAEARMLAAGK
jgi:flagellar biosynthetic protein FliR